MILEVKIEELTKQVAELTSVIGKIINSSTVEATEKENTTPSMPEEKKEVVEPKKTRATKPKVEAEKKLTLADLKDLAKNAVTRSSREDVKATIGKFGEKLSDVATSDYPELAKNLEAL